MSGRRKIGNEHEARRCLSQVEAAGGEVGAWARAHGIDGRSLNAWRVNLARRGSAAEQSRRSSPVSALVELVPEPSSSRIARYVVDIGGARVELGDDFSEPTLRRLIEVLRSC